MVDMGNDGKISNVCAIHGYPFRGLNFYSPRRFCVNYWGRLNLYCSIGIAAPADGERATWITIVCCRRGG